MASTFETLISERKYPFLLALFVLLLYGSILVFTNRFSSLSLSDLERYQQISSRIPKSSAPSVTDEIENQDGRDDSIPAPTDLIDWKFCKFAGAVDYIPCLDNWRAIKELKSRKRMEHRERHCPNPSLRCLVPLPIGYRFPVPWPNSRDMIWFDNVPHPKLVEYNKDQNWVKKIGDYLNFPGERGGDYDIEVKGVKISPDPVVRGKPATFSISVSTGEMSFRKMDDKKRPLEFVPEANLQGIQLLPSDFDKWKSYKMEDNRKEGMRFAGMV